jgi:nucleoside-diphosphate-sugar epimerase
METSYESDELNPFDDTPIFVLVTGATGYIAGWIIKQLLQDGYRVRGTVRSLKQKERYQHLLDISAKYGDRLELFETTLQGSAEKWAAATKDCDYVIHVASPFPVSQPKNEQELIQPAMAGTLSVLNACLVTPTVKRVVLTSSMLAVIGGWEREKIGKSVFTEKNWAKKANCQPYSKSKYLAEKAAWDFINNQQPKNRNLELVTILPGLVVGPLLSRTCGNSSRILITRFLNNDLPGIPELNIYLVDVRDVATAHICAMRNPQAAGNRYLCVSRSMWLSEISQLLRTEFSHQGYQITKFSLPNFLVWCVSWWDAEVAGILPLIGKEMKLSNAKIIKDLEMEFRSVESSIIEMAHNLINFGLIS